MLKFNFKNGVFISVNIHNIEELCHALREYIFSDYVNKNKFDIDILKNIYLFHSEDAKEFSYHSFHDILHGEF
ncbi:MAG: hypothetical protein M9897_09260 [Brumimicrobium sp.]|nr:hypothetical protein [Brumimicrobium sp.]